jgi:branched-chain amino acid transport system permease protein
MAVAPQTAGPSATAGTRNVLEADRLRREFGGLVAVNDVDFTIPAVDRVADRPERRGQDDVLQHSSRMYQADVRPVRSRAREITGREPHKIAPGGHRPNFQNIGCSRT